MGPTLTRSRPVIVAGAAALALLASAASSVRPRFAARITSYVSALAASRGGGGPRPAMIRLTQRGRLRMREYAPRRQLNAEEITGLESWPRGERRLPLGVGENLPVTPRPNHPE